jgi:hypothetical protein
MRHRFTAVIVLAVACRKPPPPAVEPGPQPAPDAEAISNTPAPDAAAPTGSCVADDDHCCMPDGTRVRPGGCQPSYPDDVQPATVRGADGACESIECHLKCLPSTARIATPDGEVAIDQLAIGDPVWTVGADGARIAAPVLAVRAVPVRAPHAIVEVTLDDGRVARGSAGHPLAGAGELGALAPGDLLDGAAIVAIRSVAYDGDATWDLLPDGPTGAYWADGVLLGSTLAR